MAEGKTELHGPDGKPIGSHDLAAPLYVAWQLTNECNLACLHCIEESGPGKAMPDEMDKEAIFRLLEQVAEAEVPYMALSGGEPLLHPHFMEIVEYLASRKVEVKIETNAHLLTPELCRRFAELKVKAVQVSLDGGKPQAYNRLRIHGRFEKATEGLQMLKDAGVPFEVNFCPTRFNIREVGKAVDRAFSLGAFSFFTGKTMYTGNAVRTWHLISPSEEQYVEFFRALKEKCDEYKGRMRVYYHEMGLLEELRYRLEHPAALFIVLPNGLVKLINALPFVCGDLRKDSLQKVWADFKKAWKDPRVARYVEEMAEKPELTSELHQWVRL